MIVQEQFTKLKGKTLHTLSRRKPFTIQEIFSNNIIIESSTSKCRKIMMTEIQDSLNHLKKYKSLTRDDIENKSYSPRNSAYVFALLTKIPEVSFDMDSKKLQLKK
ncbi:MAG: hypothetical protein ACOWW1_06300 [archaeon]